MTHLIDVNVRSALTVPVTVTLSVAGISETVQVEAGGEDILENVPYAHADVNISTLDKLPTFSPASGLSDAIVLSTPASSQIQTASSIRLGITPRRRSR
jgi:hypothetical protein